ncbi:hypothetical protein J5J10_12830 [Ciceribacter sp. L1K23]|uniref:hypothetical protein n=1 Tax=Ciceribacter sp. L1K23 TaxID=2820276 RepID=UPI001B8276C8|nr:hypothetical protein [Ciceribacter sp. L1K23]MBR0556565.1 hypothetical protein [Ciceribacter sp. L1K23]
MQLTASMLTDPAMRSQLEAFYENKKNETLDALRQRESEFPDGFAGATITMPDGETRTLGPNLFTAEMAEKSFVSFDQWISFMAERFDDTSTSLAQAQKRVADVEAMNPDNSSAVRATFSKEGTLYAYINEDGTLVTSNGTEPYLEGLEEEARRNGLSGEALVDHLAARVKAILEERFPELGVERFDAETAPTIREFAQSWYHGYDADEIYQDALADATAHLDSVKAWHEQWQANLYEIQGFLMGAGAG